MPRLMRNVALAQLLLGQEPIRTDAFATNGLYISATSPHPEACWQWLTYLQGTAVGLGDRLPARHTVAKSEAFQTSADPRMLGLYERYYQALSRPVTPSDQPKWESLYIDRYWFYRAVDQTLQGGDLAQELTLAQSITDQYLACAWQYAGQFDGQWGRCARQVDPDYQGFAGP